MQHPFLATLTRTVLDGQRLTTAQGLALAAQDPTSTTELLCAANTIKKNSGLRAFTCSIINAKSGACSQDCRFCAQSSHYPTAAPTHPLLPLDELTNRGLAMHQAGASCFSLVTSGLMLQEHEMDRICRCVEHLRAHTTLTVSASLGLLTPNFARRLADAGLTRYHHNLETARSYFPHICTTHAYDDDIATICLAQEQGLRVCSGGILGLGETWAQRVELAQCLADLEVETVPLNFLSPIPGTPLENTPRLTAHDTLKSVALFRFLLPRTNITIAGGRERTLGDFQSWLSLAGANGLMIGNYLTTQGRNLEQDQYMLEQGTWI